MRVTLDQQPLFDEQGLQLEVASPGRASIERAICGLDGILSIDLGERARQIRLKGIMRAPSRSAMLTRTAAITAFIDGSTHTLRTDDGREYSSVRMDAFRQMRECLAGAGIMVECEILFTQLGA